MSDNNPSGHYLVMLDERVHETKGRFQGREAIGGLFRNIEEYLHTIRDSLPLCWEPTNRQMADPTENVEHTHIGLGPGYPREFRSP